MINIGVDLHGVIDSNIDLFETLSIAVRLHGCKIYIISGPPKEDVEKELENIRVYKDIHYDELFTIVNYLKSIKAKMWLGEKNTWWASDEDWWGAKAAICEHLKIDIMIDNTEMYKPYFKNIKTKFLLYTE